MTKNPKVFYVGGTEIKGSDWGLIAMLVAHLVFFLSCLFGIGIALFK